MSSTYDKSFKLEDPKSLKEVTDQYAFGDMGDFWEKYDKLSDKFDVDMMARLNDNLDVLLIFAGLFSAINTSFLILAISSLSSGPADQTNYLLQLLLTNGTNGAFTSSDFNLPTFAPTASAVRQNCFFVASLGFSLLAAVGAVLAKQWLQFYERTGQTGPVRQQAMRRTEKFLGAKTWGLSHVVEALPGLLLLSLAFFFCALVDYFWELNVAVALVTLAFTAVGFLTYGFTLIVGVISDTCPFQTSFSTALRKLYRGGHQHPDAKETSGRHKSLVTRSLSFLHGLPRTLRSQLHRTWDRILYGDIKFVSAAFLATIAYLVKCFRAVISPVGRFLRLVRTRVLQTFRWIERESKVHPDDWTYTRSAIWMAETAPEQENILAVAQNIPFISDFDSMQLIAPSNAFYQLLSRFRLSLLTIRSESSSSGMANAVTMARAVTHIVLADPEHSASALRLGFERMGNLDWLADSCGPGVQGSEELMVLLISMSSVLRWPDLPRAPEKLLWVEPVLRKGLQRSTRKGVAATTQLHSIILLAPSEVDSWAETHFQIDEISKTLLLESMKVDAAYISCASRALSLTLRASPAFPLLPPEMLPSSIERVKRAWVTRSENSLADNLLELLDAFSTYYSHARHSSPPHPVYAPLVHCQTRLLVHAKALGWSRDLLQHPSRLAPVLFFQRMHAALNFNIQEVLAMDHTIIQESEDSVALDRCQDELVGFLQDLLLTPCSHWHIVDAFDLKTTIRLTTMVEYGKEKLAEAILYRYFVDIQRNLEATRATDPRHGKLSRDLRIGPVLISALRLYLWLYPSIPPEQTWPTFEKYLLYLATGHVQRSYQTNVIELIPIMTSWDAGLQPGRLPSIHEVLDPRRSRGATPSTSQGSRFAAEVGKAVTAMFHQSDPGEYDMMGPCMLWLTESLHAGELWAAKLDGTSVKSMFVKIMSEQGGAEEESQAEIDIWRSVDTKGAGALFLWAWQADLAAINKSGSSSSNAATWMDRVTIEAFAVWLRTFDSRGYIAIKEDDDVVFIQTTVGLDLVLLFIERAHIENPDAAKASKLDLAGEKLIQELGVMKRKAKMMHRGMERTGGGDSMQSRTPSFGRSERLNGRKISLVSRWVSGPEPSTSPQTFSLPLHNGTTNVRRVSFGPTRA
ncbi:hypothetical protein FRB98_003128 [Tulasnella sp. 332]|nr:hypothetical protein FRB98_003128 [Tulasnella sp. 332]